MKQSAADRFARQQPNRTCCNIKDIDEHGAAVAFYCDFVAIYKRQTRLLVYFHVSLL